MEHCVALTRVGVNLLAGNVDITEHLLNEIPMTHRGCRHPECGSSSTADYPS
jgi:hypothetical protein